MRIDPDNVGGLRERIERAWHNHDEHGVVTITMADAQQLVEVELCRAAPAGGDAEVVRLRQFLAASQKQVDVLAELLERNQAHHERMMKLMARTRYVVAVWQARLLSLKTGNIVHDWHNVPKEQYDLAKGESHQGTGLRVEYRVLYYKEAK